MKLSESHSCDSKNACRFFSWNNFQLAFQNMGKVTIELVRKRSEHNDGEISTLEELALHQEKLTRIENLDKWCRHLKILLLQNNSIAKLENLSRLKSLEYLNVAMNNIEVIEGLEGCESLKKLDLTLNFVGQLTTAGVLKKNHFLQELFLTGNPCTNYTGYRDYVLSTVSQLKALDGVEVTKSEKIVACQSLSEVRPKVNLCEGKYSAKRSAEKSMTLPDINDENFWNIPSPDTPEVRAQIHLKQEIEAAKQNNSEKPKKERKPRKLFDQNGIPYNVNEGKYDFSLDDMDGDKGRLVLEIKLPKYMDTSLVTLDLQPTYIRAVIKHKILQLTLPAEVHPDKSTAQRSQVTGWLVITMPKVNQVMLFPKENYRQKLTISLGSTTDKIVEIPDKVMATTISASTYLTNLPAFDESEVPPLI